MMETGGKQVCQNSLTGVAEGRMAEIVAQGNRLGKILVELQRPSHGSGNLADFKGVGKTGAVMIPFWSEKDLSFVFKSAECLAVQNPIAVNLENRAHWTGFFGYSSPFRRLAMTGELTEYAGFRIFGYFPYYHCSLRFSRKTEKQKPRLYKHIFDRI